MFDYAKLNPVHKIMMAMLKKSVEKKSPDERDADDTEYLATYGKSFDFMDKPAITPLVEYVRTI